MSLYFENEKSTTLITSSKYSFSKNTTKYLSELVFNVKFLMNQQETTINSDIYSSLIQYNNALYSLSSLSGIINQTHHDTFNFFYNS